MKLIDVFMKKATNISETRRQEIIALTKARKKRWTVTHFPSLSGTPMQFNTIEEACDYAKSLGLQPEINLHDNKEKIDYRGWTGTPELRGRKYPMFDWKKYHEEQIRDWPTLDPEYHRNRLLEIESTEYLEII